MELENKLKKSKSKEEIYNYKIEQVEKSILFAMDRLGCEELNIKTSAKDIVEEFINKDRNFIVEAIRKGSLGAYGINYKLTTQVIGYWVYQYLNDKKYNPNQQPTN